MKTNHIRLLFAAILAAVFAPIIAHAADVVATAPAAVASTPFYASGDFWSAIFGLVASIVAIWKHTELSTTQRVLQSVVMGVETATKIPEVLAAEGKIKAIIQAKATQLGVQPLLDQVVQDLTPPTS